VSKNTWGQVFKDCLTKVVSNIPAEICAIGYLLYWIRH
jgi:hypothetical protein